MEEAGAMVDTPEAAPPLRRAHTVDGGPLVSTQAQAVVALDGAQPTLPPLPGDVEPAGLPSKAPSGATPCSLERGFAKADRQLRNSLAGASEHGSSRYGEVKSHKHYQRDTVRQYRKAMRSGSCANCCTSVCSRRSSTGFWVDSGQANAIAYIGITLNTVFFAFQAYFEDHLSSQKWLERDRVVYCSVELIFVFFFLGELVLRMRSAPSSSAMKWNRYDGIFLLICFVDACILNFIPSAESVHRVVVRLLPAMQVLRVGRFVQEFRLIIKGIFSAMRAVLWSLCLLALVIYFFAVLCATCIGRARHYEGDQVVSNLFSSLPTSMFTLFTFATLEDFPDAVRHFMADGQPAGPVIAVAIIVFILFTNLSLLNLVTAVMVDTIIDILPKKHAEKLVRERAETVQRLETIFWKMDEDMDRKLTLQEFREGVLSRTEVQQELSMLQIAALDLRELFVLMDFSEKGAVAVDEFIDGLMRMVPTPASKKELLGMEYDMHKMWNMLGSGQERIMHSMEELQERMAASVGELETRLAASVDSCVKERVAALESCVGSRCAQVEAKVKEHLDAAASQLLAGHAKLQRSVEALGPTLANDRQKVLDSQQKSMLEVLEAKLPPSSRQAEFPEVSRLNQLMEDLKELFGFAGCLKEGQQQLLAVAEHSRASAAEQDSAAAAATASRCTPANQRVRPQPLQSNCFASSMTSACAADAGPEPEPHSVLHTPAGRGLLASANGDVRPEAQQLQAQQLSTSHLAHEPPASRARMSAPPPPTSISQLQPPPQFQHAPLLCAARAADANSSFSSSLGCARAPFSGQELQQLLQAAVAGQSMPAAALAAGCVPQGQGQGRVALVQQWVRQQGWAGAAFDKLVLHLDRLGVELSEAEQDALQWCLRHPISGTLT